MFYPRRALLNPGGALGSLSLPHRQRHSREAGSCIDPYKTLNDFFRVQNSGPSAFLLRLCRGIQCAPGTAYQRQ